MNVLSLFDGMSCGQIALNRAKISYKNYYASEVDKYAIKVTQANYPDTIQMGDVTRWREWPIDWKSIGLVMGGSPCQGFSFAGKRLAFDDPRSKLFFVFAEIVNYIKSVNPEMKFLLENVKMKKEHLSVISKFMGVKPILINSTLVSAQNRRRFYWANWGFSEPKDCGLILADIIESDSCDRKKSYAIDANYAKGGNLNQYFNKSRRQLVFKGDYIQMRKKSKTVRVGGRNSPPGCKQEWDNVYNVRMNKPVRVDPPGTSIARRVYSETGKSPTLLSSNFASGVRIPVETRDEMNLHYRKLTPLECERLQTVPDNYTNHVSNSQRYKMLGNGWTVDVIVHILKSRGTEDLFESRWS